MTIEGDSKDYDLLASWSEKIARATKNKIIYPSQDPAIFEVKFPDKDIRGKVVSY